jgi:hypothetical protein
LPVSLGKRPLGENDFDEEKFEKFLRLAAISRVMETEEILKNPRAAEIQLNACYYL